MPKAQSSGSRRFFKNPNFLKKYLDYIRVLCYYNICSYAGVVQWLESQPSKLVVWVRFPSPAPKILIRKNGDFYFLPLTSSFLPQNKIGNGIFVK